MTRHLNKSMKAAVILMVVFYLTVFPSLQVSAQRRVGQDEAPWRSIGKLQAVAGSLRMTCTAALVAADKVLTAAHCLFNARTQRPFLPSSMHFLLGMKGEEYRAARIVSMTSGTYDSARSAETRADDWALLTLDGKLNDAIVLPIAEALPTIGTAVLVGGYSQEQPNILTADVACRIVGLPRDGGGRTVLSHDCRATQGVSGAPMLRQRSRTSGDGTWEIVGINVARFKSEPLGLAAPALESLKALRKNP